MSDTSHTHLLTTGSRAPISMDYRSFISRNNTTISSYLAGLCGVLAGFPLDSMKTRMQTHHFPSLRACFADIIKHEGLRGFYRGVYAPLLTTSMFKSAAFTIYDRSITFMKTQRDDGAVGFKENFVAGATAGLCIAAFSSPVEVIKVQLQLLRLNNNVNNMTLYQQLRQSGQSSIRAIFRGTGTQMSREAVGFGTYFASYHSISHLLKYDHSESTTTQQKFLAGGLSGIIIWLIIFPIDLIKSRLQKEAFHSVSDRLYVNALDCVRQTFAQSGIKGFYSGIKPTLLRAFPVHALIFGVYETIKDQLSLLE